ncbi:hypothetical protein PAMA_016204 [Pampus argenteus]
MAGRRFALKAVDWVAFSERIPPGQRSMFNTLKNRSDAITAKLNSLPESPVAIDWSYYKSTVANAAMVTDFEKKFKALQIPQPVDTQTSGINSEEAETNQYAIDFINQSKARVAEYEKELEKYNNLIPFDQMTVQEFSDAFPGHVVEKVTPIWPYKPIADL